MITRRHLLSAVGGLVAFSATPAVAAEAEPRIGFMEIKRNGSQPSGKGVRRDKAAFSSGCKPHPATAPAGSNRSSHGGNEVAEAFD